MQSILLQDYPKGDDHTIEVIVQDGGSTDNTAQIVNRYAETAVTYTQGLIRNINIRWISEPDKGEPDAINKGLAKATGDIVTFIDADDIYYPGAFRAVKEYFRANHGKYWAYGKCKIIDAGGRVTRPLITRLKEPLQAHYSYKWLKVVDFIPQPAVFWRRSLNLYPFDAALKYVFDYAQWLAWGTQHKPGYIPEYLAAWRAHAGSISVQGLAAEARQALTLARAYTDPRKEWYLLPAQELAYWATLGIYKLVK